MSGINAYVQEFALSYHNITIHQVPSRLGYSSK